MASSLCRQLGGNPDMEQTMTDAERIADGMKARGFVLEGTGGGCDAYIRYAEEGGQFGSVWVTRHCDPSAPDMMEDAVDVGFYVGEDMGGEAALMMRFPSVWAFFDATKIQAETLAYCDVLGI